jgi:tetratricopeptide (TPR) repeat protein
MAIAAAGAGHPPELVGIVTQVTGAVQIAGPGVIGDPLATPWQVVRAGVTVRVPDGGAAGIVCSNSRFVRLRGPATWSLNLQTCAEGKELTPAEYALVAPQAGRFKVVDGLLDIEHEIRAGDQDDPLAPIVLSPRNAVRSPRPTVSWSRVPLATEYRMELSGRGVHFDSLLNARDVTCAGSPDGIDICSLPWPVDRPDLPPGEIFFLAIAARDGIAEPWHATDPVEVRTPTLADARTLESRLDHLEGVGLEGAVLETARAGLLAQASLYADAAESYRRVLVAAPTPELHVTLADIYLVSGLPSLAEPRYREALAGSPPSVRAAAAFGLGRVEYARGRYREAVLQFQKARELYEGLDLGEEEAAARRAANKAIARAPR